MHTPCSMTSPCSLAPCGRGRGEGLRNLEVIAEQFLSRPGYRRESEPLQQAVLLTGRRGLDPPTRRCRTGLCRSGLVVLLAALAALPLTLQAEDVVVVSTKRLRNTRLFGQIIDMTGSKLVFRHNSGREETIDGKRVIEVESPWSPLLREADACFQQSDYSQALTAYLKSLAEERRGWVKRRILVRLVWCDRYLDRVNEAGEAFRILYTSDPTTRDFAAIPLTWTTVQPPSPLELRAKKWLADRDSSVARLMGASWLLSTSSRAAAIQTLRRLASDKDPRVAFLAEAQQWRTKLATVGAEEVTRWGSRVDQMSVSIQAGPSFVLAAALARNGDPESAALAYLRIPILFAQHRRLSARSLMAAARQLEKMDQVDEARGLYREVILEFSQDPAADDARREFEKAKSRSG